MNWKRISTIASVVMLSAIGGYQLKAHAQQEFPKPCTVTIPAEWGEYKGVSSATGIVFEGKDGTLRFVYGLPCGIDGSVGGTPHVSAVIHRK